MSFMPREYDQPGSQPSPAGFHIGIVGWIPPQQAVSGITFFLNGTAMVTDQYGRPVRGAEIEPGKPVYFAMCPPINPEDDKNPGFRNAVNKDGKRDLVKLGTHAEVVKSLEYERIDWTSLDFAGWPQLPYDELKKLKSVPKTPIDELRKIQNADARKDALRIRREFDKARELELQGVEEE